MSTSPPGVPPHTHHCCSLVGMAKIEEGSDLEALVLEMCSKQFAEEIQKDYRKDYFARTSPFMAQEFVKPEDRHYNGKSPCQVWIHPNSGILVFIPDKAMRAHDESSDEPIPVCLTFPNTTTGLSRNLRHFFPKFDNFFGNADYSLKQIDVHNCTSAIAELCIGTEVELTLSMGRFGSKDIQVQLLATAAYRERSKLGGTFLLKRSRHTHKAFGTIKIDKVVNPKDSTRRQIQSQLKRNFSIKELEKIKRQARKQLSRR